jgi:hypothetical protein
MRRPERVFQLMEVVVPDRVEVHFKSSEKQLKVVVEPQTVVDPTKAVKAVLMFPANADATARAKIKRDFAKAHGIKNDNIIDPGVPGGVSGVNVKETVQSNGVNTEIPFQFQTGQPGPGVCYWVDDTLICW